MLNDYCTEKLLGLKDLILLNIDNFNDSIVIEFKIKKSIHICPRCGNETSKVHDYRIQDIKDIPAEDSTLEYSLGNFDSVSVKVFAWDSATTMMPYAPSVTVE